MKKITLCDMTLSLRSRSELGSLSFREKLELARQLDRLGVDVIEYPGTVESKSDSLLVKAMASAVQNSALALSVSPTDAESPAMCWEALREAKHPRLQFPVPVSVVQTEYLLGVKGDKLVKLVEEGVKRCRALCPSVELLALDASRAEPAFLQQIAEAAVKAGADTVTYCDDAGRLLPEELGAAAAELKALLPAEVKLGVRCSNALFLAEACALQALRSGADELKVCAWGEGCVSVEKLNALLELRGSELGYRCSLRTSELRRTLEQLRRLCQSEHSKSTPFETGVRQEENIRYRLSDSDEVITAALEKLGYALSPEDEQLVIAAFREIAGKKEDVSEQELDVIVASAAMQVPACYTLESYVINSCNLTAATAHIRLRRSGELREGLAIGDGPIDAVFLAIEQIVGCHYELDDFQIRAVTRGTAEAMGETVVRLRSQGRVYGGRGISTDIVGSGVQAYLNALNKIVYEENEK